MTITTKGLPDRLVTTERVLLMKNALQGIQSSLERWIPDGDISIFDALALEDIELMINAVGKSNAEI